MSTPTRDGESPDQCQDRKRSSSEEHDGASWNEKASTDDVTDNEKRERIAKWLFTRTFACREVHKVKRRRKKPVCPTIESTINDDLLLHIFEYIVAPSGIVDVACFRNACLVNRRWHKKFSTTSLWSAGTHHSTLFDHSTLQTSRPSACIRGTGHHRIHDALIGFKSLPNKRIPDPLLPLYVYSAYVQERATGQEFLLTIADRDDIEKLIPIMHTAHGLMCNDFAGSLSERVFYLPVGIETCRTTTKHRFPGESLDKILLFVDWHYDERYFTEEEEEEDEEEQQEEAEDEDSLLSKDRLRELCRLAESVDCTSNERRFALTRAMVVKDSPKVFLFTDYDPSEDTPRVCFDRMAVRTLRNFVLESIPTPRTNESLSGGPINSAAMASMASNNEMGLNHWASFLDWVLEISFCFNLDYHCVFDAAVHFVRVLHRCPEFRCEEYQLLLGTCLRIATLCTNGPVLSREDIAFSSDNSFREEDVEKVEFTVLTRGISWHLCPDTIHTATCEFMVKQPVPTDRFCLFVTYVVESTANDCMVALSPVCGCGKCVGHRTQPLC